MNMKMIVDSIGNFDFNVLLAGFNDSSHVLTQVELISLIVLGVLGIGICLTGWKIVSVLWNQSFTFPAFSLATGGEVKVGDSANNSAIDFHWLDGGGTWNNSKSDPAELYDSTGKLVDVYND